MGSKFDSNLSNEENRKRWVNMKMQGLSPTARRIGNTTLPARPVVEETALNYALAYDLASLGFPIRDFIQHSQRVYQNLLMLSDALSEIFKEHDMLCKGTILEIIAAIKNTHQIRLPDVLRLPHFEGPLNKAKEEWEEFLSLIEYTKGKSSYNYEAILSVMLAML